jgi:membrane protein YdbS with pleckstrin-like domain
MAIETIAISLVGCVATVVWLYVAGFYDMFPAYAATVISTMCYFVGLVVGHAVRITVQRLMPKPQ